MDSSIVPPPPPTQPNYSIYVNNLNEKVKIGVLKKLLYEYFGQFGRIVDIVCSKRGNRRGQAFVVFDTFESAGRAISKDGKVLLGKKMRIQYARTKSDSIARLDGTYEEHVAKRKLNRQYKSLLTEKKSKKRKVEEVSSVLLVENLPEIVREKPQLIEVFRNKEGCLDVKYIEETNIIYLKFQNDFLATNAKDSLHGLTFHKSNLMVSYAPGNLGD